MGTAKTKFFEFRQNNSGGYFHRDDNLDSRVFIEAVDVDHANALAQKLGIYFNGCSTGLDCSCCGDRWHRNGEWGGEDAVDAEGDITVSIWDSNTRKYAELPLTEAAKAGLSVGTFDDCGVIVHRMDGTKAVYRGPGFKTKAGAA